MAGQCSWVENLPDNSIPIYLRSAYQTLFASNDGARPAVLKYENQGTLTYLALLLREVNQGTFEAYCAYGYGGFWPQARLGEDDLRQIKTFLAQQDVVCTFIRHSPFLENQKWIPEAESAFNRVTYVRDLLPETSLSDFCKNAEQKLRWSVNHAKQNNLEVKFFSVENCTQNQIQSFHHLYTSLMTGKGTSDYYLFSSEFFLQTFKQLAGQCELAEIRDRDSDNLIAAALFLFDRTGWVHYHLSASLREAMKLQPMELLLAEAIVHYGNAGYQHLHLGGGHSSDESDGLSRFKKKFSTRTATFHCSKWICDSRRYEHERLRLPLRNPHFFLLSDARNG